MPFPNGTNLVRLEADHVIKPFNCGDEDLNDFCLNDAKDSLSNLLTVTYLLENATSTIAFFSLLNDKITKKDSDSGTFLGIRGIMPDRKQNYTSYPAMKIARLGVNNQIQNSGIGSMIIDYLKALFIHNNRTGCRFITVDAYRNSLSFYEKNNFSYLTTKDSGRATRPMYFDLLPLTQAINADADDGQTNGDDQIAAE